MLMAYKEIKNEKAITNKLLGKSIQLYQRM